MCYIYTLLELLHLILQAVPGCFRVAELPSELAGRPAKQSSFDGNPTWSNVIMYASDLMDPGVDQYRQILDVRKSDVFQKLVVQEWFHSCARCIPWPSSRPSALQVEVAVSREPQADAAAAHASFGLSVLREEDKAWHSEKDWKMTCVGEQKKAVVFLRCFVSASTERFPWFPVDFPVFQQEAWQPSPSRPNVPFAPTAAPADGDCQCRQSLRDSLVPWPCDWKHRSTSNFT